MDIKYFEMEEIFNKIKEIIAYIQNSNFSYRFNNLYLSNGEQISYNIQNECIPHLLGIQTNYLQSLGLFGTKNSFEMLKRLVEDGYRIQQLHVKGIIDYDKLFSKHLKEKVDIFLNNIKINLQEV
ncbi:MAG: hypothetical protein Q4E75_03490 [bacterium]|nr:hypothetical protein [bacterium]